MLRCHFLLSMSRSTLQHTGLLLVLKRVKVPMSECVEQNVRESAEHTGSPSSVVGGEMIGWLEDTGRVSHGARVVLPSVNCLCATSASVAKLRWFGSPFLWSTCARCVCSVC